MLKTKITEMLGIEYPIIVGTMMHLSRSEFTAAISEAAAGGRGVGPRQLIDMMWYTL